jgi:hypothetical protein
MESAQAVELVDAAAEEVGLHAILAVPEARLEQAEEIMAALQGSAVRAVLEARVEQIAKHGHGREHDAMLPIGALPRRAKEMAQMASEVIDATVEQRNLDVARRRLARTAALCLAAIDRLDMISGGKANV